MWVCDREADAVALAGALAKLMMTRRPGASLEPLTAGTQMAWRLPGELGSLVARRGARVLVVDGLPAAAGPGLVRVGLGEP